MKNCCLSINSKEYASDTLSIMCDDMFIMHNNISSQLMATSAKVTSKCSEQFGNPTQNGSGFMS